MKNIDELFDIAINHWRDNKGIGTAILPFPLNDKYLVLGILQRVFNKTPRANTFIIVPTFNERIELITFLTSQPDEENNKEFKDLIDNKVIKIYTEDYVSRNGIFFVPFVSIMYHCNALYPKVIEVLSNSKFKLVVLNKLNLSSEDMNKIYSICPLLDDFKQNEIDELRVSTPVEEEWVDVTIPEDSEDYKLLEYYNDYLTTSVRIFGSFEAIQEANTGNIKLNISSSQICYQIAKDNGWDEHLDMSIGINVQLDELYNPIAIKERASKTFEIIRNRSQLLTDYEGKLKVILDIVEKNKNKKILIINKRGEFANKVTEYINNMSESNICGNYHDKVDPIPAIDENGNHILYKSGEKKGKKKYLCSQAQKKQNVNAFISSKLDILSTSSAPDKDLAIPIEIVVITSPLCENMKNYIYRLSNVYYPDNKIKLYSLYVKDSLEENKLQNKELSNNHTIINMNKNTIINENNLDFIIVE